MFSDSDMRSRDGAISWKTDTSDLGWFQHRHRCHHLPLSPSPRYIQYSANTSSSDDLEHSQLRPCFHQSCEGFSDAPRPPFFPSNKEKTPPLFTTYRMIHKQTLLSSSSRPLGKEGRLSKGKALPSRWISVIGSAQFVFFGSCFPDAQVFSVTAPCPKSS